jgi:Family of unknown function (DUF6292)
MDLEFDFLAAQGLSRYVRLVAEELGLTGECSFSQLAPPVNAYLALDGHLPLFPSRDVALIWHEEHGWAAGIETHSGEDLILLSFLGDVVLPAPRVVAQFARSVLGEELPGQPEPVALRKADDDDDLRAQLVSYARLDTVQSYPVTPSRTSAGGQL